MQFPRHVLALSALLCGFAASATAHTVWLEPAAESTDTYRLMFGGHGGKQLTYDPAKLRQVDATDSTGRKIAVSRTVTPGGVLIRTESTPAIITLHFDNGIHTRSVSGPGVEKPMNQVPGATRATHAVKYHKTILDWSSRVTKPQGQPFEVIPLDSTPPAAGNPMKVQVLRDGKPVAGIRLGRSEEGTPKDPVTDSSGIASFVPERGFNKLWAGERIAVSGNPQYTELSYEYLLGFNAW